MSEERQLNLFEGSEEDWKQQVCRMLRLRWGWMANTYGYRTDKGWLEVIAGKRVVAFEREDLDEVPSAKSFGFVQTYEEKPRKRLCNC